MDVALQLVVQVALWKRRSSDGLHGPRSWSVQVTIQTSKRITRCLSYRTETSRQVNCVLLGPFVELLIAYTHKS
jgi:hypothetical protein